MIPGEKGKANAPGGSAQDPNDRFGQPKEDVKPATPSPQDAPARVEFRVTKS